MYGTLSPGSISSSRQEIDFTAGTDSHLNDRHVEAPGSVRQVAVPPAARALSTLSHVDYEDAFLVETGVATFLQQENQIARALWAGVQPVHRRAVGVPTRAGRPQGSRKERDG